MFLEGASDVQSLEQKSAHKPTLYLLCEGKKEINTPSQILESNVFAAEKNLFDCIREEDVDTLRHYVERGGPVHVADTLGDTSLLVAASTGNAEVVKASTAGDDVRYHTPRLLILIARFPPGTKKWRYRK